MSSGKTKLHYTSLSEHTALFTTGVPILCYHKISTRPRGVKWRSLYVAPSLLAQQMAELRGAGFTSTDLCQELPSIGNPERQFAITFDDGYASVLANAATILAAHRLRAILFIVAGAVGGLNHWDIDEAQEIPERLMDVSEIKEWISLGHTIGSHSVTHPRLTRLPPSFQKEELTASKRRLEDTFGVPVEHFCYPYGDVDEALQALVMESGYRTACTQWGGSNTRKTKRSALRRLEARYAKRSPKALLDRFLARLKNRHQYRLLSRASGETSC